MGIGVCRQCCAILISRSVHDFVACKCDNGSFVDGGDDYYRAGGKVALPIRCATQAEAKRVAQSLKDAKGPKEKAEKAVPPPLSLLTGEWKKECPDGSLRFGQWVFNKYLNGISSPYDIDTLYNTHSLAMAMTILEGMYDDYQWPKS